MTDVESTDTDALLKTVREGLIGSERPTAERNARAALDSLSAELERVKAERDEQAVTLSAKLSAADDSWADAVALLRVSEARLDKALSVLRETRDTLASWLPSTSSTQLRERIDAAIAEIEGYL
jgi:hypothetical protein